MQLYYSPGTCSLSPHIVLRELDLNVALNQVKLDTHTLADGSDFYGINSRGQVPVLVLDNGALLREGSVITQYLIDRAADQSLLPAFGDPHRYAVLEWQNYVATEIHKGYAPLFAKELDSEGKNTLREILCKKYQWLDDHLAGSPYLAGDSYSVADIYLFVVSRWAPAVGLHLGDLDAVQRLLNAVSQRPAVQSAMDAEGLLA